jgi:hypothetical protein
MPIPLPAVESIRRWWYKLGQSRYPNAKCLTITADCGGSNRPQVKLWKRELQRFADETGLTVTVAHLPPGTSKWNKIEHRLFAFITMNWRGKPAGEPSGYCSADRIDNPRRTADTSTASILDHAGQKARLPADLA